MGTIMTPEFEKLKLLFESLKLTYEYIPVDNNDLLSGNKVQQMAISLGEIETKPLVVQIIFLEDVVQALTKVDRESRFFTLQFYITLPITINLENIGGISSLILSLNPFIPLGSFGISNTDEVFFRYNYLQDERDIKDHIVTEIIDNINFYLKSFVPQLIAFSEGKANLDESMARIFEALRAG
jgi:hypothetical protein